jgi:hypothetical protein
MRVLEFEFVKRLPVNPRSRCTSPEDLSVAWIYTLAGRTTPRRENKSGGGGSPFGGLSGVGFNRHHLLHLGTSYQTPFPKPFEPNATITVGRRPSSVAASKLRSVVWQRLGRKHRGSAGNLSPSFTLGRKIPEGRPSESLRHPGQPDAQVRSSHPEKKDGLSSR